MNDKLTLVALWLPGWKRGILLCVTPAALTAMAMVAANLPVRVRSNISLLRWCAAHLPQAAISNEVIIDGIFLYVPFSFDLKLTPKLSWLSSQRGCVECLYALLIGAEKSVWAVGVGRQPCDGQSSRMQVFLRKWQSFHYRHNSLLFFNLVLIKHKTMHWGLRPGQQYFAIFSLSFLGLTKVNLLTSWQFVVLNCSCTYI